MSDWRAAYSSLLAARQRLGDASELGLRPALASDIEFLFALHRVALGEYVKQTWGWDEAFQRNGFRKNYLPEQNLVVQLDGRDVGCLRLEDRVEDLFLSYVALEPSIQGRGYGTLLTRLVLELGARRQKPVRLNVMQINPARKLYERLGFKVTGFDEARFFMEAQANSENAAS